ncbi:MAG TPA: hypothetical protein VHW95_17425 [Steroidobacteraceae bacterium]|jgi:hypothetical protein|nr:hypothetical protein [Steroidobacteraceae bacterium]
MNALIKMVSVGLLCWCAQVSAQQTEPPASSPQAPAATPPAKTAPAAATPPRTEAQSSKPTAQSEAGEPRANTSKAPTAQSEAGEPRANNSRPTSKPRSTPGQKAPGTADRLELGTATVTGDREQPKVMYIVPWKKSDIGDLAGRPMNSLVDEILAPVDRDVFKREVVYYKAVQADTSQNGARARPSDQGEK